jgi:hypothetical protein
MANPPYHPDGPPGLADLGLRRWYTYLVYPQQQPLRRFADDRRKAIWEEIARLLADGFIMEVLHLDWLSNPFMVEKKKDEPAIVNLWRMCVDYTNLNKACPKDPFSLP